MHSFSRISVVGLGYIGLPTCAALTRQGLKVTGVDVNERTVDEINTLVKPLLDGGELERVRVWHRSTYLDMFVDECGDSAIASVADVDIDVPAHKVTRQGEQISLTPLEFDLLVALARTPGQPLSREALSEAVRRHGLAPERLVALIDAREEEIDGAAVVMRSVSGGAGRRRAARSGPA